MVAETMKKHLYTLAVIFFILDMFLGVTLSLSFRGSYYHNTYEKYNTAQSIGISEEDLDRATSVLLNYTRSKRSNLDLEVEVNGKPEQMFNEREKAHMVDVRDLYSHAILFIRISLVYVAMMLLVSLGTGDYLDMNLSYITMKRASILLGTVLTAIAVFAILDFQGFWIMFHKMIFSNDLWLLNPNTDRLIMMVPEPFFRGLVYQIISVLTIIGILYGFVMRWFKKVGNRI